MRGAFAAEVKCTNMAMTRDVRRPPLTGSWCGGGTAAGKWAPNGLRSGHGSVRLTLKTDGEFSWPDP
ncbi:hypothetical protein GCM10009612_55520 [Streptomyces beijiangensis]